MKGIYSSLVAILALATMTQKAESTRIWWVNTFSPSDGYRMIKHRSQKKLRKLARQRGI